MTSVLLMWKINFAKKLFKTITIRSTELLELIHPNLADFKTQLGKVVKSITQDLL